MASDTPDTTDTTGSGGPVSLGVDGLLEEGFGSLVGYGRSPRLGFLTHDGARVGSGKAIAGWDSATRPLPTSRSALIRSGFDIVRLFSPEHGIAATAPDGAAVESGTDSDTGLPVVSLYGAQLQPDPDRLADLDLVLVDLQDIGARFYTYLWTVVHLLEAAEAADVPVLILDRPNPIGGEFSKAEGPILEKEEATFLGRWPVPVRHSLTLGEMVQLLRQEMGLSTQVDVVPMVGWKRSMLWEDTGLAFHPPSPGIPTPEAALLYPTLAFLEATNLQVGRGTERAFQWFGAPWIDGPVVAAAVEALSVQGVRARSEGLGSVRGAAADPGIRLTVTDPTVFQPVAMGLRLLALLSTFKGKGFSWADYSTAVNPSGSNHLRRLVGRADAVTALVERPETIDELEATRWCRTPGWADRVRPHLLYS